jgi:hypothetical protein
VWDETGIFLRNTVVGGLLDFGGGGWTQANDLRTMRSGFCTASIIFYSTPLFSGLQISRFNPFCLETIRSDRATATIS